MKKKNMLVAAIVGILTISALAACGQQQESSSAAATATTQEEKSETQAASSESGGETNLVMAWWGNQVRNERTQQVLDLYSEQNPGITFDGQFSENADYWKKMATASAGHTLPDIMQMDYKYIEQYASNELLVDLMPYIESGVIDVSNCDENVLNSGKVGEGLYGICNGINAPALFYNKSLLDENGIEIKDNMTLDEFIDVCREVYEKAGYKSNVCYSTTENLLEYLLRADGKVLFEKGRLGVDSADEIAEYLSIYALGMEEGWHVHPSVLAESITGASNTSTLVYGSSPDTMSWCSFAYSNMYTAYKKAAPEGMVLGVTTWSSKDPAKSNYLKPSQFFSISVDSKNADEAAKVIDYLTNSVECNNILLGERGIPLSSEVANAIAPNMDETSQEIIEYIYNVVSPSSSQINPPMAEGSSEVISILNQLVEQICYGEITVEDAAQQIFEEGNQIMASK